MPAPWDETRLTQAAEVAAEHGCASAVDVESLVAEVRHLRETLHAIERALLKSPLVKPYKREQEARALVRSALEN